MQRELSPSIPDELRPGRARGFRCGVRLTGSGHRPRARSIAGERQARFGRKANYKPELVGFHSVFTALSSARPPLNLSTTAQYHSSLPALVSGISIDAGGTLMRSKRRARRRRADETNRTSGLSVDCKLSPFLRTINSTIAFRSYLVVTIIIIAIR